MNTLAKLPPVTCLPDGHFRHQETNAGKEQGEQGEPHPGHREASARWVCLCTGVCRLVIVSV